jgi:hypothetical protein
MSGHAVYVMSRHVFSCPVATVLCFSLPGAEMLCKICQILSIADTLIVPFCIMLCQMSSSLKEYWEKREAEVGAVVTGTRARKPSRKRQADSTDDSSSVEKDKAQANDKKRMNHKLSTKKSTKKQATTTPNQVANSESKIK